MGRILDQRHALEPRVMDIYLGSTFDNRYVDLHPFQRFHLRPDAYISVNRNSYRKELRIRIVGSAVLRHIHLLMYEPS